MVFFVRGVLADTSDKEGWRYVVAAWILVIIDILLLVLSR